MVAVAIDAQGAAKARPYYEKAGVTLPAAVDADNVLGELLGFKAVPNAVFVDADGVIRYTRYGGFDVRKREDAELVKAFLDGGDVEPGQPPAFADQGAWEHFREGLSRLHDGDVDGALSCWRKGTEIEPDNWVIRKQIWAIENPDRFYGDAVDFEWQFEQMSKGT